MRFRRDLNESIDFERLRNILPRHDLLNSIPIESVRRWTGLAEQNTVYQIYFSSEYVCKFATTTSTGWEEFQRIVVSREPILTTTIFTSEYLDVTSCISFLLVCSLDDPGVFRFALYIRITKTIEYTLHRIHSGLLSQWKKSSLNHLSRRRILWSAWTPKYLSL